MPEPGGARGRALLETDGDSSGLRPHGPIFSGIWAAALGAWKGWTQVSDLSYFLV